MATPLQPFNILASWLGVGEPPSDKWRSIDTQPLLILVGLTGVGKSTTVEALADAGLSFSLLPNRRSLTDSLIITRLQVEDGQPIQPVIDRTQRFDYTRRYREQFAGGMAHALSQLWVNPSKIPTPHLLFDGLRGENEVRHAAELLPRARFIILDAPHFTRVLRLLDRADVFDQVNINAYEPNQDFTGDATQRHKDTKTQSKNELIFTMSDLDLNNIEGILSSSEAKQLESLVQTGDISAADLQAKLRIVLTERQNYDPDAALAALNDIAPTRTFVYDTVKYRPGQIAAMTVRDLG